MYLGIDPSVLSMGVVSLHDNQVEGFTIGASLDEYRGIESATVQDLVRVTEICEYLARYVRRCNPVAVAVEGGALGRQLNRFLQTGILHALVYETVIANMISGNVITVSPKSRAKFCSGNGNAGKDEVVEAVSRKWFKGKQLFGRNSDLYDAFGLAVCAREIHNFGRLSKIKFDCVGVLRGNVVGVSRSIKAKVSDSVRFEL